MKNLMKKNIIRAMENWPSRKPCVKESLREIRGVQLRRRITYDDEPCITGCGEGAGVGTAFAMVVFASCHRRAMLSCAMRVKVVQTSPVNSHAGIVRLDPYR